MKKLLSLFMATMMLPFVLGAMTLQPNQLILGHYTSDNLNYNGWGKSFLYNKVLPIATDITSSELALFQGSKIVAFRVGLAESAPVTRVFVIPVSPNGTLGDVVEWECEVSDQGWNLIELPTPYEINLPDDYSLRIGFDFEEPTRTSTPISAVNEGTIYPTLIKNGNNWINYGVNTIGNLSIQCICENDNFSQYILRADNLKCKAQIKTGDDLQFTFSAYNLGTVQIEPGELTFEVAVDGNVVATLTNPATITSAPITISGSFNTAGIMAGAHTLSVTTTSVYGEPVENPATATTTFKVFEFGFTRQMHLVEQFTSTWCQFCPQGSANIQNLCNLRDDIAWVAVHENMGNTDPFRTEQCDSITNMQGIDGFPEGTFDRTAGISSANSVWAVLTYLPATTMSSFLDYVSDQLPSFATVNVNSTYDPETRKAVITIDGELVPNFDELMGADSKLNVYITEDGLVAPQTNGGNNYVHNNVLRKALVSVKGVALKKTGDSYKNEFTYTIPSDWNADNLNIVAFISRPLRYNAFTDIYVTNTNKRKLGEFDEPTSIRGDVDGDGEVTIADATALIDYLLTDGSTGGDPVGADCNLDGNVTIADITALIDRLLLGRWL